MANQPIIVDIQTAVSRLNMLLLNYTNIPPSTQDLPGMVRYEFDCMLFGDMYRDFTTSPFSELFEAAGVPTDVGKAILKAVNDELRKIIGYSIVSVEEFYHYQVEWMDAYSVMLCKLNQAAPEPIYIK